MDTFIQALLLVVIAEMGDKTQLLAMAMASKYKIKEVLSGVLIATIFNHGLAVAVGSYLSSLISMRLVNIVAAISFLIFGFWTLRGDKIDKEGDNRSRFGPIVTVSIAFFLAEMGDKTQLMTITISAKANEPIFTLIGTTMGMIIADGIGIIGGAWIYKHIPDKCIKWTAGGIFIFFGTLSIYNVIPSWMFHPVYIIMYIILLGIFIYLFGVKFAYGNKNS
ncbi:TMEM165/GDT1 family protein [Clostridium sp. BJN0013]|uniref:TMEM165/GDT1 family protein n=1 Tax=Clostridium sp. BJN0013 TaxID=3236840 RepID=UPI0034C6337B